MDAEKRIKKQKEIRQAERGKKFRRFYAIFRIDEEGKVQGYVENSFSMSWRPDWVRIYDRASAFCFINSGVMVNGVTYKDVFVLRVSHKMAEKHGVKIDTLSLLKACKEYPKSKKFNRRNAYFEVVDFEKFTRRNKQYAEN